MTIRFATWNINSVRLRLPIVQRFIAEYRPDILCLQEIKCVNGEFPWEPLKELGFPFIEVNGQAGYHGVATLSRIPMTRLFSHSFCGSADARHLACGFGPPLEPFMVHNLYIPSGGDIPDPEVNRKFRQKLVFLSGLADWFSKPQNQSPVMLMAGDFNVAPLENDVWSHKQMLKVVSHTPVEIDHLKAVQSSFDWRDPVRAGVPEDQKLYSWWSYRARDWQASNRGRRLDHIWVTAALEPCVEATSITTEARGWTQPSDHVPVIADIWFLPQ